MYYSISHIRLGSRNDKVIRCPAPAKTQDAKVNFSAESQSET
jgi:hypothetical protein